MIALDLGKDSCLTMHGSPHSLFPAAHIRPFGTMPHIQEAEGEDAEVHAMISEVK